MNLTKYFSLLIIAVILVSCSKEESTILQDSEKLNLVFGNENPASGSKFQNNLGPCFIGACDPDFNFPEPSPGIWYRNINITYNPDEITIADIPCVRQEYFQCYSALDLRFPILQSDNPWNEVWKIEFGKPGGDMESNLCDDPRTRTSCDD